MVNGAKYHDDTSSSHPSKHTNIPNWTEMKTRLGQFKYDCFICRKLWNRVWTLRKRSENRYKLALQHIFSIGLRCVIIHSCRIVSTSTAYFTTRLLQLRQFEWHSFLLCSITVMGEIKQSFLWNASWKAREREVLCIRPLRQIWNEQGLRANIPATNSSIPSNRLRRGSVSKPYWWVLWQTQDETVLFFFFLFSKSQSIIYIIFVSYIFLISFFI